MLRKLTLVISSFIILASLTSCNSNNEKSTNVNPLAGQMKYSNFQQAIIDTTLEIKSNEGLLSEDDLAKFAQSLGDARIVGLGEQTHGAGSVFRLKTQLIKYLHEYHDFDVFILESGLFDVQNIWKEAQAGQRIKDIAPDNIFYMYAKTAEVTPLFDYINKEIKGDNPLILVGFDSQHTGGIANKSLVDALTQAVNQSSGNIKQFVQWQVFSDQIQQVLDVNNTRFNNEIENLFFKQLHELQQMFSTDSALNIGDSGFWYRISKGLEAQAKRQWKIADNRSQEMGENIKYWAEKYPDKKIIVWAHTWHLTRDGGYQVNAGQIVTEAYGKQYFMVHFTGASGEYVDFVTMKNKVIKTTDKNMVETLLNDNTTENVSFLNLKSLKPNNDISSQQSTLLFSNDYKQTLPAHQWSTFFDGIFFIKNIEAAHFED
jgi:erythromycin esterase